MKKNKKLLSSFICLLGSIVSLTIGLSSCVLAPSDNNNNNSDDSIITPPDEDNKGEDDNNENEEPIEPNNPEIKPPSNDKPNEPSLPETNQPIEPPNSNLINKNSINLKEYGQLLPSQYLLNINDLNSLEIDKTKIVENFDRSNVLDVKYTTLILDDLSGILSIKIEYKSKIDYKLYEFVFNFSNLAKLENKNYSLYFDIKNKNLLNAKEISDSLINGDNEAKSFLKNLEKKGANLVFRKGTNILPINYLDFEGGITITNFKESWYTSNNDIELDINLKYLKINYYKKDLDSNYINIKKMDYPSNLAGSNRNPIKLTCSSVLDYLLNKVMVNESFKENKFASYYYYDILYDNATQTQLQLTNNKWLKNVENSIEGYDAGKYRIVISKTSSPNIDKYGNLTLQIQMQFNDDGNYSKETKELVIKSFLSTNENLFYYNGNKFNKFNLFCDIIEQEQILNSIKIKKNFSDIKNIIENSNDSIVDVSKYFKRMDHISFKNKIKLYFGDSEIKYNESSKCYTSTNNIMSIEYYSIKYLSDDNVTIQYNKKNNCFQTKFVLSIDCQGIDYESSTSDEMTVNITKINTSLE